MMQVDVPFIRSATALWNKLIDCAGLQLTAEGLADTMTRFMRKSVEDSIVGSINLRVFRSLPHTRAVLDAGVDL